MRIFGCMKLLVVLMMSVALSGCSRLPMQPSQAPAPTNTPRIVINIGPPNAGESAAENPFEGTQLPPVVGRSPTDPPGQVVFGASVADLLMVDHHGLPAVEVVLNGSGPYRFVVDWGANLIAMSPQLAMDLNLPILGVDEMGNPNAQVDSLAIGPIEFQDLTIALDPFFLGAGEAGVLGRNVYENLLVTLDYPEQRIRLEQDSLPQADGRTIFDYTPTEGGAPMLEMNLQGHSFPVVLDTGAARGLILPVSEMSKFSFASGPASGGTAIGPQLGAAETQVARLQGELTFGGYTILEPVAVILDRPEYLAGSRILRNFAITLDQQNGTVRLERDDPSPMIMPLEAWETITPTP
jgi:hypothetical protein